MFEIMRLMLVRNGKVASHYLYDANGVRVYKVVGDNYAMNVNGAYQGGHAVLHTPTLYASPYVVATPKGYTKHYYAGSERIASRIGGGGLGKLHDHVVNPEGKLMQMNDRVGEGWRSHCFCREDKEPERSRSLLGIVIPKPEKPVELPPCSENEYTLYFNTELRLLYEYRDIRHDEPETYFYHSDHLGSSSWITNQDGDAIQHLQYLPLGEQYVDQRTTGWNAMLTFSGKERDEETGYSYFGARYYDSDLSIWLSVDPLADKYPGLSPYVYCMNNPIKLVDPNGMEVEYNSFTDRLITGLARIFDGDFRQKFKTLKKSDETYVFNYNKDGENSFTTDGDKLSINYSIDSKMKKEVGQTIFSNLRHETTHGDQFEHGEIGFANNGKDWQPINYDLTDEYGAASSQNDGFFWKNDPKSTRVMWIDLDEDKKMSSLRNAYSDYDLKEKPLNNPNTQKMKNPMFFMLPRKER